MKGKILVKQIGRSNQNLWLPVSLLNVDLRSLTIIKTLYQFTSQTNKEFEFRNKTQFMDMLKCKPQRRLEIIEFLKKNGFLEIREGRYIFKRIEATSNNLIPADIRYVSLLEGSVLRVYLYLCHAKNHITLTTERICEAVKINKRTCVKALNEMLQRRILKIEGETVRLTDYNEYVNEVIGDVVKSDLETNQNVVEKDLFDYVDNLESKSK